jgi:hypothetical protein
MLHLIKSFTDSVFSMLCDDPVRPHIPHGDRVGDNKDIFVLRDADGKAKAITCVSYQSEVPTNETELFVVNGEPEVAIFYTIWSYAPGSGRSLIFDAESHIKEHKPNIKRYVTLSPKTDTAKRFHIRNGAGVFRENADTINYEYHRVIL